MKKSFLATCIAAVLLLSCPTYACGIKGSVVNSDGSRVDGTSAISTSWNSKKAYPRKGTYRLDLGSSVCGKRITVYLDHNQGKTITVNGWVTVNYVRR